MPGPVRGWLLAFLFVHRTVGGASALALARVLALTSVVAGRASAVTLAGILTLAGVLFGVGEIGRLTRQSRGDGHINTSVSVDRCGIDAIHCAAQQARKGCCENHRAF